MFEASPVVLLRVTTAKIERNNHAPAGK